MANNDNAVTYSEEAVKSTADGLRAHLQGNPSAKELFCACWSCAKKLLEMLEAVSGLDPRIKAVIKILIAAGDRVHESLCKSAM
jgi:hypothetical protein